MNVLPAQARANIWSLWRASGLLILTIGVACFLAGIYLHLKYQADKSEKPLPQIARIYAQDDHGHIVFLTKAERDAKTIFILGGWALIAIGQTSMWHSKRLQQRKTEDHA